MGPRASLQAILDQGLIRRIGSVDAPADADARVVPTGIEVLDAALPGGGLVRGMTHEWVLESPGVRSGEWPAPLLLLTHLSGQAGGLTVFVGERCWPRPWTMAKAGLDPCGCLFVEAGVDERAWAIDQALRCPCVGAVVGDVEGMGMADSRRLQLAAEAGQTLGLLTRPAAEAGQLSACGTRWVVRPCAGATDRVRWRVELRRCKAGAMWSAASGGRVREWVLEWEERRGGVRVAGAEVAGAAGGVSEGVQEVRRETCGVRVAADVARGPGQAKGRRTA